jgi:integrase/recombinase XerD
MKSWNLTEYDFLSAKETQRLRDYVTEKAKSGKYLDKTHELIVLLCLGTGLRNFELAQLKVKDIHLDDDRQSLFVNGGKGNKDAVLPISDDLKELIIAYLNERPIKHRNLFVSSRRKPYSTSGLLKMIKGIYEKAGIDSRFFVHTLRKVAVTEFWVNSGFDLAATLAFSRHARPETLMIYIQAKQETAIGIVNQMYKKGA